MIVVEGDRHRRAIIYIPLYSCYIKPVLVGEADAEIVIAISDTLVYPSDDDDNLFMMVYI